MDDQGRIQREIERDRERGDREETQREYNNHINCREVDLNIHTYDNYWTKEI